MEKKFRKLNAEQVKEIRKLYATGRFSLNDLAKTYGISQLTVFKVVEGVVKPLPPHDVYVERFMSKVDKSGGEDTCWIWKGSKNNCGYGNFNYNGRNVNAHVFSYEQANNVCVLKGVGVHVCHSCDNPACVNPNHLSPDTPDKNGRQMRERGRDYKGGKNPKLNELQMLEVICFSDMGVTQHSIANYLGVTGNIVTRTMRKDPFELQRKWIEKERASNA